MNLHSVVAPIIAAVNPNQTVNIKTSNGFTQSADFTRTPNYTTASAPAQIQALTGRELRLLDALMIQGTMRAVYFYGDVTGLIRASQSNGSLVQFPDGSVWMVVHELEPWSVTAGWCKCAVSEQQASVWSS